MVYTCENCSWTGEREEAKEFYCKACKENHPICPVCPDVMADIVEETR